MKATKCDRCGKFFVDGGKKVKIIDNKTSDLCDECMKELLKWMEEISKKRKILNENRQTYKYQ